MSQPHKKTFAKDSNNVVRQLSRIFVKKDGVVRELRKLFVKKDGVIQCIFDKFEELSFTLPDKFLAFGENDYTDSFNLTVNNTSRFPSKENDSDVDYNYNALSFEMKVRNFENIHAFRVNDSDFVDRYSIDSDNLFTHNNMTDEDNGISLSAVKRTDETDSDFVFYTVRLTNWTNMGVNPLTLDWFEVIDSDNPFTWNHYRLRWDRNLEEFTHAQSTTQPRFEMHLKPRSFKFFVN